jgi:hypothetical protein
MSTAKREKMRQEDLASLQRQLDKAHENLRLIQERKAEYVLSTDIPPQLIKEERRWLDEIAELERQLAAQPAKSNTGNMPEQSPENDLMPTFDVSMKLKYFVAFGKRLLAIGKLKNKRKVIVLLFSVLLVIGLGVAFWMLQPNGDGASIAILSTPTPSLTYTPIPTYTSWPADIPTPTPISAPTDISMPIVVVLKTYHNQFVKVNATGVLMGGADQAAAVGFILFHLSNGKVALETSDGRYITADKSEPWTLKANAQDLDKAQQFILIDLGDGMVAFETDSDRYVTAMGEDFGWRLRAETRDLREYERFTLLPLCYRAAGTPCRPPDTSPNWTKVMNFKGEIAGRGCTDTIHISPPQLAASIYISMTAKPSENPNWGYSLWEVQAYKSETGSDNLAKLGSVIASSEESPALLGRYATDGDLSTRWSSEWQKDPQWLKIVLPTPAVVGRVELVWETAVAQDYCVFIIPPQ